MTRAHLSSSRGGAGGGQAASPRYRSHSEPCLLTPRRCDTSDRAQTVSRTVSGGSLLVRQSYSLCCSHPVRAASATWRWCCESRHTRISACGDVMRSGQRGTGERCIYSQYTLEFRAGLWHQVEVGTGEVPLERLVRCASRRQRLVERGVVLVPCVRVLAEDRGGG